jgi:hypothetical protein
MRRSLVVLASSLTVAVLMLVPGSQAASRARPTTASNRQLAIKDASRTLDGVVAPAGAKLISSGAASGHRAWSCLITEAFDSAIAYRSWTVPGDISSVLAAVQRHLPKGLTPNGTGSGGPPPQESVMYSRPPVNGKLGVRYLEIIVGRKSANSVTVFAETQSQYIATRTAAEQVPASARVVDLVSRSSAGRTIVSRVVTKTAQVNALIRLFDSLLIIQPGAGSCPAMTAEPTVTMVFRAVQGAPVLAGAQGDADANFSWPDSEYGWGCFATSFSVRGHNEPALVGNIDGPIQRILHLKLT